MSRRKKKPSLPKLKRKADAALSKYVRARTTQLYGGKCPICGRGPLIPLKITKRNKKPEGPAVQACFHFVRAKYHPSTRWDIRNVIGTCHKCNWVEYRDPDISRAWYIETFGVEAYLKLVKDSTKSFTPTVEWLTAFILEYELKLKELHNTNKSILNTQGDLT